MEIGPSTKKKWHDTLRGHPTKSSTTSKGAHQDVHSKRFFTGSLPIKKGGKKRRKTGCTLSTVVLLCRYWDKVLLWRRKENPSETNKILLGLPNRERYHPFHQKVYMRNSALTFREVRRIFSIGYCRWVVSAMSCGNPKHISILRMVRRHMLHRQHRFPRRGHTVKKNTPSLDTIPPRQGESHKESPTTMQH